MGVPPIVTYGTTWEDWLTHTLSADVLLPFLASIAVHPTIQQKYSKSAAFVLLMLNGGYSQQYSSFMDLEGLSSLRDGLHW